MAAGAPLGLYMKKMFLAATAALAVAGAATAASATTFAIPVAGTWTATYNSDDHAGLAIKINGDTSSPASGTFSSVADILNGGVQTAFLFNIGSSDLTPGGNPWATVPSPFSLTLNFTAPGTGTGSISGGTVSFNAFFVDGRLHWLNDGNTTANLGSAGTVNVHLNDVAFRGPFEGEEYAQFSLSDSTTSAAPEPMSWALMLMGFGGLGAALRFSRRQSAALTAA